MDTSIWKQEAERLRDHGKGYTEIANEVAPLFGEATHDTVWFRVYRHLKRYDASKASKVRLVVFYSAVTRRKH